MLRSKCANIIVRASFDQLNFFSACMYMYNV